jgi:signal-transduction protein with cAMP-binding, CBS, and nucleotidyltransferase domain
MAVARGAALSALRAVAGASGLWAPLGAASCRSLSAQAQQAKAPSEEPPLLERSTIAEVLQAKGSGEDGSWLWCTTTDTVFDAVKKMTEHNVGALLVLKPGETGSIAGIVTERDYLRKIIVQGRSSKTTGVGEIMTEENKLITVTPDTKVLKAMELMTANKIRHIPVVENQKMKGMVSIKDVITAVLAEHREEVQRLNEYIKGSY